MWTVPVRRQPCLLIINMIASVHIICEGSTELTANIFKIKYVGCWPQREELFPQVFSSSHNNITGIRDFEPCFLLIWREDMMSPDKPTCFKYSMLEHWKRDILMLFHFFKEQTARNWKRRMHKFIHLPLCWRGSSCFKTQWELFVGLSASKQTEIK